jgi:hypothetical protein
VEMIASLNNALRLGAIAALGFVLAWVSVPDASARFIGSSLRDPNNARGLDCTRGWLAGRGFINSGETTCTWFTVGRINSTATGFANGGSSGAPSTGRITNVSVKSRAAPARLQVTILRQISQLAPDGRVFDTSCCFFEAASRPFQPRANRVSTFRVNLPVETAIFRDQRVAWVDYAAISALGRGSLPIFSQGVRAHENALTPGAYQSRAIWPRLRRGQGRIDGFGQSGFEVLARFNFQPGR